MADRTKQNPGPTPDRLKIEADEWESAVEKALSVKRPKDGWPRPEKPKTRTRPDNPPEESEK